MKYDIDLQTNYPKSEYNWKGGSGKTISTSGCCPTSVRNILVNLVGVKTSTKAMCTLAISCGARVNGGTAAGILLGAAQSAYGGFDYEFTTSDRRARDHAQKGGMVLCHTTGANKVFSTDGHFVAMLSATKTQITIADPYYKDGKWKKFNRPNLVQTTDTRGIVTVSKETSDNSFDYYYLITKWKDTDDMKESEVRDLINKIAEEKTKEAVSAWAKAAFEAATKAGILDGTSPRGPVTREQLATVLVRLGMVDIGKGPSAYAESAWEAAAAQGILDGTNPRGPVTREQLATVLSRLGMIK